MRVKFATVGGLRCRWYQADGTGLPIVLVHGAGAAADTWVRNISALAEVGPVYVPDLLGHGFTDAMDMAGRAPQEVQVKHLLSLIDHWELKRYAIVGSSFGGLLAALVYFARPDQVDRLIVVGSASGFHPPEDQSAVLEGVLGNQSAALAAPSLATIRQRNVGSNFVKTDSFEEIVLVQLNYMALPDRKAFFDETIEGLIRTAASPEWRVYHRLDSIAAPTLVITGREDPRADWRKVEAAARRIPQVELQIFDRCGHKPYSEHAALFNERLVGYLSRPASAGQLGVS